MKVRLDENLCEAHGLCELSAPDVFDLGDEDIVTVRSPEPAPELWPAVRTAAKSCPRLAITVDED